MTALSFDRVSGRTEGAEREVPRVCEDDEPCDGGHVEIVDEEEDERTRSSLAGPGKG